MCVNLLRGVKQGNELSPLIFVLSVITGMLHKTRVVTQTKNPKAIVGDKYPTSIPIPNLVKSKSGEEEKNCNLFHTCLISPLSN